MTTPNIEELRKLAEAAIPAMVYEREYKNFEKSITPECVIALLDQMQSQAERIAELDSLAANAIVAAADSQKAYMTLLDEDLALRAELEDMAVNTAIYEHLVGLANDTATRLLKERDTLRAELEDVELHTKQVERGLDKATAQLAEIEASEPVGQVSNGMFEAYRNFAKCKNGVKLYTHPMPAQPDWLLKSTQDLAHNIRRRCFPEVPQFEVLDDLAGVISQIDNMTCGMVREPAKDVETDMINLPEPVAWFANYGGNVYTEAQLKQAVRDALDAQGVTELVDALSALIESTIGVDQVSIVNDARTVLSKYKGGKA